MCGLEVIWKSETDNQNRICAVEVGARSLIIANVEATWVADLRDSHTFFTKVILRKFLKDLAKYGGGIDRPASVELIPSLHKL